MQNGSFSDSHVFQIVKAVLLTTVLSFLLVFLLSLSLRYLSASAFSIRLVNVAIRGIGVFFGCFLCLRGEKGLWKGALAGLLSAFSTRVLFCAIAGDFSAGALLIAELAFSVAVGAFSGVLAVSRRR